MRNTLLWLFLVVLAYLPPVSGAAQTKSSTPVRKWTAIITAHPDDWQLFMGAAICEEAQRTHRRLVFVCLTGGQSNEPADAYWQSREAGYRASIRQAVKARPTAGPDTLAAKVTINGHEIDAYRYKNTVAYFLHLPDGGLDGKGLARGRFQSLKQLRETGRPLTPLDGGNSYLSWDELSQTIRQLLAREAIEGKLTIHCPQPDERCNPGDHADHRLAGELARSATQQVECQFLQYVGYNVARRPANLTPEQTTRQRQVYQAYSQAMGSRGQYNAWDDKHLAFIGHQYLQVLHQAGPMLQPQRPAAAPAPDPGEDEEELLASGLVLQPNYPNPITQSSILVYYLPVAGTVWLRVLDMQGREVLQLLSGNRQDGGRHEQWLDVSRFPAAGNYVAELRVGGERRLCRLEVSR